MTPNEPDLRNPRRGAPCPRTANTTPVISTEGADFGFLEPDRMFTRTEAAHFLKVSVSTLERWAAEGIGPKVVKIGPRKVGYPGRALLQLSSGPSEAA